MSRRITTQGKKELETKILEYAEKHGSFCVNSLSQLFGIKWETINTSVQNLLDEGRIFVITGTKNPRMYTIWPDNDTKRTRKTVLATLQERELCGNSSEYYARPSIPWLRATSREDIRRSIGFVCHPSVKGREVDVEFVRAHWQGSFNVEVLKRGQMLESWKLDDAPITGSWKVTPMSGNLSCTGRINLPEDSETFTVNALTRKDGTISKLKVYVHSRYIYYKASDRTALAEFRQQVQDVLDALTSMGWEFGEILDNGKCNQLHRAINEVKLGMMAMSVHHEDNDSDLVHFDCSHGTPEAEVYGASQEANDTIDFLANPLERIVGIETTVQANVMVLDKLSSAFTQMSGLMQQILSVLTQQSEAMVKLIDANEKPPAWPQLPPEDGIAYGRCSQ